MGQPRRKWNICLTRNKYFRGRDEIITKNRSLSKKRYLNQTKSSLWRPLPDKFFWRKRLDDFWIRQAKSFFKRNIRFFKRLNSTRKKNAIWSYLTLKWYDYFVRKLWYRGFNFIKNKRAKRNDCIKIQIIVGINFWVIRLQYIWRVLNTKNKWKWVGQTFSY